MISLLEDLELIFVQFFVNLGNLEALLANDLDGAGHLGFLMLSEADLSECASA